jgi:O-methyltransferase domain/Dimerisation domain
MPSSKKKTKSTPQAEMRSLIAGYWVSRLIYVAARLNLADLMKDGPHTADELARRAGVNGPALYRMLRTLSSYGVFTETRGRRFKLTPLGSTLRSDAPASMHGFALFLIGSPVWNAWEDLEFSVRTGQLPFDRMYGMPFYQYLNEHPENLKIFGEAMTSLSGTENPEFASAFQKVNTRGHVRTLVDVGGGFGSLLALILKKNAGLNGVLFDLPSVIERARKDRHLTAAGIAGRCSFAGGDMFESVPKGCDAYVMKYILHNWDDEHCVQLLTNCREAMNPGGRILVADSVVPPAETPDWGKLLDIQMMVVVPGKERTKEEFAALFKRAGLRLTRIIPTNCPLSLVEGVAARR